MDFIRNIGRITIRSGLILIGVFFLLYSIIGCETAKNNADIQDENYQGAIRFGLYFDGTPKNMNAARSLFENEIDVCVFHGVSAVKATVYNSADVNLASKSWPCSDHQGTIESVPVGSDYRVVVEGWEVDKDESSWQGEITDITVTENTETDAGEVVMSYTDELDVPANAAAAPGNESILVSWHAVREAAAYNIYWSTSPGVSKSSHEGVVSDEEDTSTYIRNLTNATTYYFVVTSSNDHGESDESEEFSATPDTVTRDLESIDLSISGGPSGEFGWSVTSGDFNGDGLRDVIVSDPVYDGAASNTGAVFVYYGDPAFTSMPSQTLEDPEGLSSNEFGFYVSGVGDINGDGYDDLLVAMNWGVNKAYLIYGSADGLSIDNPVILTPPAGYDGYGFGHGVSSGGDINGDNYSDFIIATGGGYGCVYYGSNSGIAGEPDHVLSIGNETSNIFVECSIIGDINGDGYDDVALNNKKAGPINHTDIFVYHGSATGINTPNETITVYINEEKSSGFQVAPAAAGDFSEDGYQDLVIGNQWASYDEMNEGEGRLYLGSTTGLNDSAIILNNPTHAYNSRFGNSVDGVGDFNYDGKDDVIIGCPYDNFATIYYGEANPTADLASINFTPGTDDYFGWSVSGAGDIIGNGENFVVIGSEFGAAALYAYDNAKPTANAGSNQVISSDVICQLDGRQSTDPDNDLIDYQWKIDFSPSESSPVLSNTDIPTPILYMDMPGTYIIELIVNDGLADSDPDLIEITRY